MGIEGIATFIGIVIGWAFLTIRKKDDERPTVESIKRKRRAQLNGYNPSDDDVRLSVDAVLETAQVSKRLLDRLDDIEEKQAVETKKREDTEEQLTGQIKDMKQKIAFLQKQDTEKTKTIKGLRKEVRALKDLLKQKGYKVTTDELSRLVDQLPDEDDSTS